MAHCGWAISKSVGGGQGEELPTTSRDGGRSTTSPFPPAFPWCCL